MSWHADWITLLEFLQPKHPLQVSLTRETQQDEEEDSARKKLNEIGREANSY